MRASADSDFRIFRRYNSLLFAKKSLFFEIFSLLICVGNCEKSDCGAAVSCYGIGPGSLEIAIFPVKFPVSREFAWRRVRLALRRPPPIPTFGQASQGTREWAGIPGFSRIRFCLQTPNLPILGRQLPKVSGHDREYSRFAETAGGDLVRSRLPPEGGCRLS
jgi:hypothetical protein